MRRIALSRALLCRRLSSRSPQDQASSMIPLSLLFGRPSLAGGDPFSETTGRTKLRFEHAGRSYGKPQETNGRAPFGDHRDRVLSTWPFPLASPRGEVRLPGDSIAVSYERRYRSSFFPQASKAFASPLGGTGGGFIAPAIRPRFSSVPPSLRATDGFPVCASPLPRRSSGVSGSGPRSGRMPHVLSR